MPKVMAGLMLHLYALASAYFILNVLTTNFYCIYWLTDSYNCEKIALYTFLSGYIWLNVYSHGT